MNPTLELNENLSENSRLKCPVCGEFLTDLSKTFACPNHHTFDRAKEDYLNLILNAKKTAGDAKPMMTARQNFLNAGYYQPLSDHVNALLARANSLSERENATSAALETSADADSALSKALVDIGCGEGYYLSRFAQEMDLTALSKMNLYGLDISKVGVKMAAKRNKNIQWLVANFAHLPFMDGSVDTILSMFAEYSVAEMTRILKAKGAIVIVRAGKDHLQELKKVIYPEIHDKAGASQIKDFPGFTIERHPLTYQTTVTSSQHLQSLLLMTPHYWKIRPESAQKLAQLDQLTITVSVEVDLLYRENF